MFNKLLTGLFLLGLAAGSPANADPRVIVTAGPNAVILDSEYHKTVYNSEPNCNSDKTFLIKDKKLNRMICVDRATYEKSEG